LAESGDGEVTDWLNGKWTEETERGMAKQMRGLLQPGTILEGIRLFQSGSVKRGEWIKSKVYTAEVKDTSAVCITVVDFGFLPYSRCSCREAGSCSHMAAVILDALFSRNISVQSFLRKQGLLDRIDSATQAQREMAASIAPPVAGRGDRTTGGTAGRLSGAKEPSPNDGYRKWHRIFNERMATYSHPPALFLKWVEHQLLHIADGWDEHELRSLYRVHGLLYAMRLSDRSAHPAWDWKAWLDVQKVLIQNFVDEARSLNLPEWLAHEDGNRHVEGLAQILGEYAFADENSITPWLDVYRFVWNQLSPAREWIRRERERLESEIGKVRPGVLRLRTKVALAHLILLEQGDAAAISYLDEHWDGHQSKEVGVFFFYLHQAQRNRQWDRMRLWLDWLKPQIASKATLVQDFLKMWDRMAEATEERGRIKELRRHLLRELLPASFTIYARWMLQEGDYAGWIDLHVAVGQDPQHSDGYEAAAKKAPEALLPFHHLQAEQWIEERNRNGYKAAVGHLRQLKTLYARMKREDLWRVFTNRLMARYSRLKALREELERGGIIP
jgi:hypothetical protein